MSIVPTNWQAQYPQAATKSTLSKAIQEKIGSLDDLVMSDPMKITKDKHTFNDSQVISLVQSNQEICLEDQESARGVEIYVDAVDMEIQSSRSDVTGLAGDINIQINGGADNQFSFSNGNEGSEVCEISNSQEDIDLSINDSVNSDGNLDTMNSDGHIAIDNMVSQRLEPIAYASTNHLILNKVTPGT